MLPKEFGFGSLFFSFLAISLISAQNLIKNTNSSPVYAVNSNTKIIELIANNVKSEHIAS